MPSLEKYKLGLDTNTTKQIENIRVAFL